MIGKIGCGKSAYHLLRYCLEDKKTLSEADKLRLSEIEGVQHKHRAEVLVYNNCFGNAKELNVQFREVERMSSRAEKPVFHISLRPASVDRLTHEQWVEIAGECAKEFNFSDHQYLVILHRDAKEPHLHIVANRIGYDGKAASDSNSYKRMANLCRRLEKQFGLQEVLSPRPFLSAQQRQLPRQDVRREKLRNDLNFSLQQSATYPDFEGRMKALGYQVLKGRGITFIDDKKVRIKGSEVGFSLATIEKILKKNRVEPKQQQQISGQRLLLLNQNQGQFEKKNQPVLSGQPKEESFIWKVAEILLQPDESYSPVIDPFKVREDNRKKKNKKQGV